ncbi:hypothetical protein HZ326_19788 [Fusarium oxysporum f. sp. albedinis]|nr:hypothetical protein HZ326_19788 [Fusarium oxysporum f. sp. albedinis]
MDPSVLIDIVEPAARVLLVVQRFPATDLPASGFYAEYARHLWGPSQARNGQSHVTLLCGFLFSPRPLRRGTRPELVNLQSPRPGYSNKLSVPLSPNSLVCALIRPRQLQRIIIPCQC